MNLTRREFMRALGVTVASVMVTRCRPTCYAPVPPDPKLDDEGPWSDLRQAWYDLDLLARDARDYERGQQALDRLRASHRAALNELVELGELDPDVADDLHTAFDGASYHVWRANAPITCYVPAIGPEYQVESSSDLARRAELLAEMAERSEIDPTTVEQARAAIERDIGFLALAPDDQRALIDAVIEAAGDGWGYPGLHELDFDVPPSALEAARILVEVLLRER